MVDVLGIPLYDRGLARAVADAAATCTGGARRLNRCVSATGAHGLVLAQRDAAFAAVLRACHWNLPDGMPGVWIGRLKGAKAMDRCYGPEFFRRVLTATREQPVRHFLCGGNEGVADELRAVCAHQFGNPGVVGTHCPPFRTLTDAEVQTIAERANALAVDIVWIGISTPKQETLARRLAAYLDAHFIVTVGAAFDFHTGRTRQAPAVVQRMGLEWLFRLCLEPRRLYKRYLQVVPMFIFYNLRELFSSHHESDADHG